MDILKADIFFFISTVATIVLTIFFGFLLFYLIKAARNLYRISNLLKSDLKDSEEFLMELKERLNKNIFFKIFFPPLLKSKKKIVVKKVIENKN